MDDHSFMSLALEQAKIAELHGEVPVGAVVVHNNQVIASAYNQPIARRDPTAHAEIAALRMAAKVQNNYRLIDTTVYVTLEPCLMCVGAMVHARISRCVFAASDPKSGALGSVINALDNAAVNHRFKITKDVMSDECSQLLKDFFKKRRKK